MKNNQGFSNILLVVLFLVLFGVAGFFGYNYYLTSNSLPNDMPELPGTDQLTNEDSNKDEPSKIVESVKQEIESNNLSRIEWITKPHPDGFSPIWWITEDGYSILTESNPSIIILLDRRSSEYARSTKAADFDEINLIVKNKLLSQGFKLNELNSNTGFDGAGNKEYIDFIQAYEKPGIKCVGTAKPDNPMEEGFDMVVSAYIFSCTTDKIINQNYMTLKPFIDIVANARGEDRKTFVISYLSIEGETARASFRGRRTGAVVSYYKENDTWKFLDVGQAESNCADLIKRGVPKKFQEGCIEYNFNN